MYDIRLAIIYTRDGGFLATTKPTIIEQRFTRSTVRLLEALLSKDAKKGAGQKRVFIESVYYGRVEYRQSYKGKKKGWVSTLVFERNELEYEEMRHVIILSIFALTGQAVALNVSFDKKSATWFLPDCKKMQDFAKPQSVNPGLHFGVEGIAGESAPSCNTGQENAHAD
jgi:hypothetical protein